MVDGWWLLGPRPGPYISGLIEASADHDDHEYGLLYDEPLTPNP